MSCVCSHYSEVKNATFLFHHISIMVLVYNDKCVKNYQMA